jgi:hypothetical protein
MNGLTESRLIRIKYIAYLSGQKISVKAFYKKKVHEGSFSKQVKCIQIQSIKNCYISINRKNVS